MRIENYKKYKNIKKISIYYKESKIYSIKIYKPTYKYRLTILFNKQLYILFSKIYS